MDGGWELIEEAAYKADESGRTTHVVSHRMRTPRGWLIRTIATITAYQSGASVHVSQTEVLDGEPRT